MMLKRIAIALTTATMIASCTTSPTGRDQLLLFSSNDMANLGASSFEQMKEKEKISDNSKINAYVRCVTDSITKSIPLNPTSRSGRSLYSRAIKLMHLRYLVGKLASTLGYSK